MGQSLNEDGERGEPKIPTPTSTLNSGRGKKSNWRKLMNKRKCNKGQKTSRGHIWGHEWWAQVEGVSCR